MTVESKIIWRRLDLPGHEYASIMINDSRPVILGTAIFVFEKQFYKLDYRIECNAAWETLTAKVSGFVGEKPINIEIAADAEKHWTLNDAVIPPVENCTDIDLNFSPVTNTLPIRRTSLAVGEKASVRAAWLKFPSFTLEPLEQVYERTGENFYTYESAGGAFRSELETNDFGLVTKYKGLWEIEK